MITQYSPLLLALCPLVFSRPYQFCHRTVSVCASADEFSPPLILSQLGVPFPHLAPALVLHIFDSPPRLLFAPVCGVPQVYISLETSSDLSVTSPMQYVLQILTSSFLGSLAE
jgi:hypothetical protein